MDLPKSIPGALCSLLYHAVGDGRKSSLFSLGYQELLLSLPLTAGGRLQNHSLL